MDKEILKELGMTGNETEIYLTLLQQGSISVNEIAQRSGMSRPAVYDALERLLEKGFVSYVLKSNKKHFQAMHPEKIIRYLHEKEEKMKAILPELISLTTLPREDTFVEVFKGREIVRTVYRDVITEFEKKRGEVLISGADESTFLAEDKVALEQHLNRIKKLKCKERILIREGDTMLMEGSQTEYRFVAADEFNSTPILVYNNKIATIILGNPNYAIIIENKNLAETYRKQFNVLWKIARPVKR